VEAVEAARAACGRRETRASTRGRRILMGNGVD
jgi:hypothetical protein